MGYRIDPHTGQGRMMPAEEVDPRRPAAVRGPCDPFANPFRRGRPELNGQSVNQVQRAHIEEQAPSSDVSHRNALVGNGPKAELLSQATQELMRLHQAGDEAPELISQALQERRAELEQAGADVSDSLLNADLTVEFAGDVDDEADTIAAVREQEQQFLVFVAEQVGNGDLETAIAKLDALEPELRAEAVELLNEGFALEAEHAAEYGEDDQDGGEDGGDGFEGGDGDE